jgi:hypothetical protein
MYVCMCLLCMYVCVCAPQALRSHFCLLCRQCQSRGRCRGGPLGAAGRDLDSRPTLPPHSPAHTSAYVSIRQHTSAYVRERSRQLAHSAAAPTCAYVSIRQHTTAYVSIRQHTPAYASIRQRKCGGGRGQDSWLTPPPRSPAFKASYTSRRQELKASYTSRRPPHTLVGGRAHLHFSK